MIATTIIFLCRYIEKTTKDMSSDRELIGELWELLKSSSQDEKQRKYCIQAMKKIGISFLEKVT